MKALHNNLFKNTLFCSVCSILMLIRIQLANWVGIWFWAHYLYDDALLISYTDFKEHFSTSTIYTLLKYLGYSVYLKLISFTPFTYATCTALLWGLAAILVSYLCYKLVQKRWFSLLVFTYILFMPMAFESFIGTRLYRNAILAPSSCISLTLMILTFLYIRKDNRKVWKSILLALCSGIAFTFTYYNKEDGIWLYVCLLFTMVVALCQFIYLLIIKKQRTAKAVVTVLLLLCIPISMFNGVTEVYKSMNLNAYGVSDLQTRTDGELGNFVNRIYSIESKDRTANTWAPYDAILNAYEASPTFQQYPQLFDKMYHSEWYGENIEQNQVQGDYLTWVLRTALDKSGVWQNEKQVSDLFKQINKELDEAFEKGILHKQTDRIQLLSSAGGRTVDEILSLNGLIVDSFKGAILLKGYEPGAVLISSDIVNTNPDVCKLAVEITHIEYLDDYSKRMDTIEPANAFCTKLFNVYQKINITLFSLMVIVVVLEAIRFIVNILNKKTFRKKIEYCKRNYFILCSVFMIVFSLAIGILYSFGINWFLSYVFQDGVNMEILNFYEAALPVFVMFSFVFTGITLIKRFEKIRNNLIKINKNKNDLELL